MSPGSRHTTCGRLAAFSFLFSLFFSCESALAENAKSASARLTVEHSKNLIRRILLSLCPECARLTNMSSRRGHSAFMVLELIKLCIHSTFRQQRLVSALLC